MFCDLLTAEVNRRLMSSCLIGMIENMSALISCFLLILSLINSNNFIFFQLMWPPISIALKESLSHVITPEVNKAWEHLFIYIGSKVIEGITKWTDTKQKPNGWT